MMDLHAGQVQGFFKVPVDELTAMPLLIDYFNKKQIQKPVVVATDIGISKKARDFALRMDAPLAIIEKRRIGNRDHVESLSVIGDVNGREAILFDDEINTGGSMVAASKMLSQLGVQEIFAVATHGVLPGEALTMLDQIDDIKEFVITDTVPFLLKKSSDKFKVISIAPLFGEAIKRIHEGKSVGALFGR
jgi:ribose-phosphate pyrophosphokinase